MAGHVPRRLLKQPDIDKCLLGGTTLWKWEDVGVGWGGGGYNVSICTHVEEYQIFPFYGIYYVLTLVS